MSTDRVRRIVRWTLAVGSGGLILTGTMGAFGLGGAGATVAPGTGSSYAQTLQDTPHDGSLAVGLVMGEALAGHTNYVARAQSQGVDEGAIGASLQGYNCGTAPSATQKGLVPNALQTETGNAGAAQGITQSATTGASSLGPATPVPPTFGSTEYVLANATPYGEADTTYAPVGQGVYTVSGMTSKAWSGLVNGVREAGASADIGAINLLGNVVVLKNLHWDVVYPTGGTGQPTGSFTFGGLAIGGKAVPAATPAALAGAVNAALGGLGIQLVLPAVTNVRGVEFVSPLQLEVVPNKTRDTLLNTIIGPAQKALFPVTNGLENGFGPPEPAQLAAALCQSDTPITVADITIASLNGGGYFSAAFGGVNATSADVVTNPFNLSPLGTGTLGSTQFIPGTPPIPGTAGTPAVAGFTSPGSLAAPPVQAPSVPLASAPASAVSTPAQAASALGHGKGGPLLAIGLGALLLTGLLVDGDRRLMRRAQHVVTFDTFDK